MKSLFSDAKNRTFSEIAVLIGGAFLLFIPFSGKPFHIDSPVTVYVAEQLLVDPLNPPAGTYGPLLWPWNHTELTEKSVFRATSHPPLISYWVALFIKIWGTDERVVNWAFFPFYAGILLFFYLLCKQIGVRTRFAATALFAISPVLYVNAQNAMYDVPLAMFCCACFYYLFRSDRAGDAMCAGLFAGLACLTKITAGTLILSGMFHFIARKKWKSLILFCGVVAIFNLVWMLHNLYFLHGWQLTNMGYGVCLPGDIRYRFERMVSYLGAGYIVPVLVIYLWIRSGCCRIAGSIIGICSLIWSLLLVVVLDYSVYYAAVYWLCSSAGGILILQLVHFGIMAENGKYDIRRGTLLLHASIQIVASGFLPSYASRYSLPFIFIMVIMTIRMAEQVLEGRKYRVFISLALICSLLFSVFMSISDYQFVMAEKKVAQECRLRYPERTVYFKGRLGYLYYMYHAGARSLTDKSSVPQPGDIVVQNCISRDDSDYFIDNKDRLELVDSLKFPLFPLRTMGGKAGFYGQDRLLFDWSGKPADRVFHLYEITR